MKRVVWDQAQRVGTWVCERLNCVFDAGVSTAIGMESNGELIGGVVFDNFRHGSIAMHVASNGGNGLTREFLRAVFGYCFIQMGVNKVIGLVDSTNLHARKFDENLGFVLEAVIKDAAKDGDILIYTMTRTQCRFLTG